MQTVLGRDITLYMVNQFSALVEMGGSREVRRAGEREMLETSDNTSGRFTKFIPGKINQRLLVTGLVGFSNGSLYDSSELYDKLVTATTTPINFEYKEDNGTYIYTYAGKCLVKTFEESSQWDGAGIYNVELQIVGEVTKTSTGTFIPYYWFTSDTELTADEAVDIIEAGGATSVTAPSYSTITINWMAPGGKWLYFAIPLVSPERLSYYVSIGDQGRIGQPGDLFNYSTRAITIGSNPPINYYIYGSNVSKVNNSPMDLRTFYPTSGGIMGYGTVENDTYTLAGTEGISVTIPAWADIQLNKIITIMRSRVPGLKTIASPTPPEAGQISWDATTGTIAVNATEPFETPDEIITIIYLT